MSVVVKRPEPVVVPPPKRIEVTDDVGDRLIFAADKRRGASELAARLEIAPHRMKYVRVTPDDARGLAAALVEWADSVAPQA